MLNDNVIRRINCNKTQILRSIRLNGLVQKTLIEDKHRKEKLMPDEEVISPPDELYTISWDVDFEHEPFKPTPENKLDTAMSITSDNTSSTPEFGV